MDYNMKAEISHIVRDELESYLVVKECPQCKVWQPMVKVSRRNKGEGTEFLRCLGCLHLFHEKLIQAQGRPAQGAE